jgi:hypothetical protein
MLVFAIVFAKALAWVATADGRHRVRVLSIVTALLLFELLPAPRPLYSAEVPRIYRHIAAAPSDIRVLELPFGIRDGTSSVGDFTARSQFFQTMHGKPLLGGYLSRVSQRRLAEVRSSDMLDALIRLSEGRRLPADRVRQLAAEAPAFVDRAHLGFVVIDRARTPAVLRQFALEVLQLRHIESDGDFELYRPRQSPP